MPTVSSILSGFVDLLAPRCCPGCARPLELGEQDWCSSCAPLLERYPLPGASYRYGGPLRDAIRRFKYEGRSEFAPPLGRLLAEGVLELPRVDLVVHVPMHRRRRLERGYDQAALLAREFARHASLPFRPTAVVRTRDTGSQVGRNRDERARALGGAFEAGGVEGRTVLVIDDVHTTGSSFVAVRDACLRAGARAVETFALARAESDADS